jgi:hypothetical protein
MFGKELQIENNVASAAKENDGYRITLLVERLDGNQITQEEAREILTNNISSMFTQRISFGGRS